MIIYVDLVFLLNIFLDCILLMGVSVILTRNVKMKRILLGSLIGGISGVTLFMSVNSLVLFLLKIILGILMIIVTFGYHNLRYTLNNLFYLLTLSFSVGGVMYLLMEKGIYNYFLLIIGFVFVTYMYIKQGKSLNNTYSNYYKVVIYYKNRVLELTGFLDTGNKLYDNYKHRPIILIDKDISYDDEDIVYVPYLSLNNQGIIKCFKIDRININGHLFYNYLVGISNQKFQIDGINCILHSKMKGELHA